MAILEIRGNDYYELTKDGLVIVDFYSDRCVPCNMFSRVLEVIEQELPFINIVKVNSSRYPQISYNNRIGCFPTVLFIKDGREVHRHLGFMDPDTVKRKIKQILS